MEPPRTPHYNVQQTSRMQVGQPGSELSGGREDEH